MIQVVLRGRTGNTLFQYAVGRALAWQHQVPLVLDASWMSTRDYGQSRELTRLPLKAQLRRGFSLPARTVRAATRKHWLQWRFHSVWYEPEDDHRYDSRVRELPESSLLVGYYQSWRYFSDIRHVLLDDLDMSGLPSSPAESEMAARIGNCESVAVHVRRTDYLDYELTRVCGESYYRQALAHLRGELANPSFFIFSDDPAWCRKTFAEDHDCQIVEIPGSGADPFIDMKIMSMARHNIIVNSSYSWWAAWLNRNPAKIVVAPDKWGNGGATAPIEEKIPPEWRIIRA